MRRYCLVLLLFFVLFAAAGSGVIAMRYFVWRESDEKGLLHYQIVRLDQAQAIDTVFVGDSSLGNGVDAALFDRLAGTHSLNLALNGVYGYAGSVNMLRRALASQPIQRVVMMQTGDLPLRATEYDGALFTLDAQWPTFLPLRVQFSLVKRLAERLTEYAQVGDTLWRLITGDWPSFTSPTDYPAQGIRGAFVLAKAEAFDAAKVNTDKMLFLKEFAALCQAHALQCVYLHGPLHERLIEPNVKYFEEVDRDIAQAGLVVGCPLPLAMPNDKVGDSYDHIAPLYRPQTTAYYAWVLNTIWHGKEPDCRYNPL